MRAAFITHCLLLLSIPSLTFADSTAELRQKTIRSLRDLQVEMDLLVRNQRSTRSDIQRQEREFKMFRVFEAMPLATVQTPVYLNKLIKPALEQTAKQHDVRVQTFRPDKLPPTPSQPKVVRTTDKPDWLKPQNLVETLEIDLAGEGSLKNVRKWLQMEGEPRENGTWIEPLRVQSTEAGKWTARVRTYRFRQTNIPRIKPRDPLALLPKQWPRDLQVLERNQPEAAELIAAIRELSPKSEAALRDRAQFMLNGARMSFYIKHGPGWSPTFPSPRP